LNIVRPGASDSRRLYAGIFLLSMAVLLLELVSTRIFSVLMYYHFAFLVVSLALLGAGFGALIFQFLQGLSAHITSLSFRISALLFPLAVLLDLWLLPRLQVGVQFDAGTVKQLVALYFCWVTPFLCAGYCLAYLFRIRSENISRLYFWDLFGASVGCVMLVPVLNTLGGAGGMALVVLVGWLAAVFLLEPRQPGAWIALALPLVPLLILVRGAAFSDWFPLQPAKGEENVSPDFVRWNSLSRVTVRQLEEGSAHVEIDADASTEIPRLDRDSDGGEDLRTTIAALPYILNPNGDVLIIGPGGGTDVLRALHFGARSVTGVEVNPIIAEEIMQRRYLDFSGHLYRRPRVNIVVDEGRSFIRGSRRQFDVIQATLVDTWAATAAGAFSLTENNLYTVEAFKEYLDHLSPQGALAMTRWELQPPQQTLRLVSLARAALQELGTANAHRHLFIVREAPDSDRVMATFLLSRSALTDEQISRLEAQALANNWRILYSPRHSPRNVYTDLAETPDPAGYWKRYGLDISPPRDVRPFFFNSVRWDRVWDTRSMSFEASKTNLGILVLEILLFLTVLLSILFLLIPLPFIRKAAAMESRGSLRPLFYFFAIGLGFIAVEIGLIQRFILFLGHPVYAVSVILFCLLLFSSAGSFWSGGAERSARSSRRTTLAIAVLVLALIAVLPRLIYGAIQLPLWSRILLVLLVLFPPAFLMGKPMPLGLKLLRKHRPHLIPWAWAVNGAASVVGSVVAVVLAMTVGFNGVFIAAAACYVVAFMAVSFL
jgi:spermidine synthase